jgi:kumamolisin
MAQRPGIELAGSVRAAPDAEPSGAIEPDAVVSVTVYLRDRAPSYEGPLTRAQFAERHGAATGDVAAVRRLAASRGLAVGAISLARRAVQVWGPVADLAATFGTELRAYRDADGSTFRGREGALFVPADVAEAVVGVFGLDARPQARAQFRVRAAPSATYTPREVAAAYGYPEGLTGAGECVGLVELGGGFRPTDLDAYFGALGLAAPTVEAVAVDGAANQPSTAGGPDVEVMLDIEVAGSIAPGATLAVYFAPNTDQGFLDAVTAAVHDAVRAPSVLSISWGQAEGRWTPQAMGQFEQAFAAAAAMGVTVTVAAGDAGSTDGIADGLQHVDFPASAPHALACGGTTLRASGTTITSETVWNDGPGKGAGGGGVSTVFPVPAYQAGAHVPATANPGHAAGRGVPDVCGDADPDSGYGIRVDGEELAIGGTSAVAPLWAGLVALLNEGLGRPVGLLQPFLYAQPAGTVCNDVVTGSNGAYAAEPGWDCCTGLGSPRGAALLAALRAAGTG